MSERPPALAVFCDYENVALGARDAKYPTFDIGLVLERLLDKGSIVVKKAYADWDRYKPAKRSLHEASFELIEIPHVSYSGKNSADIRMVVDALDLCHTKGHVSTFVIVSGDSDFSPLVNKLRENAKTAIGLGVKNSTSDLFIECCDEFIYYDDLVRERASRRERALVREPKKPKSQDSKSAHHAEDIKEEALDHVLDVVERLLEDRDGDVWSSMVKQTLKRKRPNFSERFHGYRSFNHMLEDARDRGLLEIDKDERSGGYRILALGRNA